MSNERKKGEVEGPDVVSRKENENESTENSDESKPGKDQGSSTNIPPASKPERPTSPETEIINLDEIEFSDEDTWLYTLPKDLSVEEKGLSPYKWLRKDVEDLNNKELQMAKTALVSKLNELDILKSIQSANTAIRSKKASEPYGSEKMKKCNSITKYSALNNLRSDLNESSVSEMPPSNCSEKVEPVIKTEKLQTSDQMVLNNVTDVLERARLQEESLWQSSSKFFSQVAKVSSGQHPMSSPICVPVTTLSKPASVEALYTSDGRTIAVPYLIESQQKPVISNPSCSPFGSAVSLNFSSDVHRSSLPNLDKSYGSLKPKKAKRISEPRIQCSLPVYPKADGNGAMKEVNSILKGVLQSPTHAYGESHTLPSSYRTKSRNKAANQNFPHATLSRRESAPFQQCQKSPNQMHMSRRDSSPWPAHQNTSQSSPNKGLRMPSPLPSYGGSSPMLQNSKMASLNHLMPEFKNIPNSEYPRCSSHSPVKRQPLTSVHNRSPKQEDSLVTENSSNVRKSPLPSKIASPAVRSGIPVPTQLTTKINSADTNWSQDLY